MNLPKLLLSVLCVLGGSALTFSQENCTQEDLFYIGENNEYVQQVTSQCGQECLFAADPEGCFEACMSQLVPLTSDCIGCFSAQVDCATSLCFFPCVFGSDEQCAACIEANCLADFQVCAGIVDNDGDGFTTLSDCDDNNPLVYPGAPGTGEGIDNNCDGVIDGDELAPVPCLGDFDGDQTVSTSDLLVFLSDFGCTENCIADLDGDDTVGTNDLLLFLTYFGITCD